MTARTPGRRRRRLHGLLLGVVAVEALLVLTGSVGPRTGGVARAAPAAFA